MGKHVDGDIHAFRSVLDDALIEQLADVADRVPRSAQGSMTASRRVARSMWLLLANCWARWRKKTSPGVASGSKCPKPAPATS